MESRVRFYLDSNNSFDNFTNSNTLKILLLGYGKSSKALIKYFKNKNVTIDILRTDNKKEYYKFLKDLPLYDICFRSPGIAINKSIYTLGKLLSKEMSNELVYGLNKLNCKHKIIITGSNGKTSLCLLLKEVLSKFSTTHLYGNIGETLLDNISKIKSDDFLIIEASSFQLENLNTNVDIGIIKNLFPNHLNATFSLSTYYASKKRLKLYANMFIDNKVILNSKFKFKDNYIYINDEIYLNINELNIKEESYIENILYCLYITDYLSLDVYKIKDIFKKFKQVKYRNNITKYKNTIFVNDGKSSSSESSKYCFSQYKGKRILILGGIHKSNKFNIKFNDEDEVYIYGKDRYKIQNELKKGKVFLSLKEVLNDIKQIENKVIIFSPGGASFDQYESYEKRSQEFAVWIKSWIK